MKRHGNLYAQVCAFANVRRAARQAQKGKRSRPNVARFNFNLETELLHLCQQLTDKTYCPGPYRSFRISQPKPRLISAAPYRDRVVHHALCNIIESLFERSFIHDSYANRKNKGTHRAVDRCTQFSRKNRYVLQCDISQYFPSIDHQLLLDCLARKIKDPDVLWLIGLIVASANPQDPVLHYFPGDDLFTPSQRRKGLPIGNLTSQFFANVYLNGLDHFIKRDLSCRYYIRYVDDFVVFSNDKAKLHRLKQEIADYLLRQRLYLHPTKSQVFPVAQGIPFLDYRIYPTHRRLKRANIKGFTRRLHRLERAYHQGRLDFTQVNPSIQSWIAHASHADTYGLRRALLDAWVFRRGPVS